MKVVITYTSDSNEEKTRVEEMTTLEELISLMKKEGENIILKERSSSDTKGDLYVEVYDAYREI